MNRRYFPLVEYSPAQVGASSFSLSVMRVLQQAGVLRGIVLYSRDEAFTTPCCERWKDWNGVPTVIIRFHFQMDESIVASSLSEAFDMVCSGVRLRPPMVYYQTDTLLQYHPKGFKFCITHHGPIVSHFIDQFSLDLAHLAFGGTSEKVRILDQQQRKGIRRLLKDQNGTVIAHSKLQQRILEGEGLPLSRIKALRPPIGIPTCRGQIVLPQNIRDFVADSELLLFTAVARLDFFKNVDLVIRCYLVLLSRGAPVRMLIVGDAENDNIRRGRLLASVPPDKRRGVLILPRLSKDCLYALFATVRRNGIFLCPSRYETLGITPLEAAASGVMTLVTETPNVEALEYIPPNGRTRQDPESIASSIEQILRDGIPARAEFSQAYVRQRTSLEGFSQDLLKAWAEMSNSY